MDTVPLFYFLEVIQILREGKNLARARFPWPKKKTFNASRRLRIRGRSCRRDTDGASPATGAGNPA